MKTFVIYDQNGTIYAARYGEVDFIPNKLDVLYQEIPDEAMIDRVDLTDHQNPQISYTLSV